MGLLVTSSNASPSLPGTPTLEVWTQGSPFAAQRQQHPFPFPNNSNSIPSSNNSNSNCLQDPSAPSFSQQQHRHQLQQQAHDTTSMCTSPRQPRLGLSLPSSGSSELAQTASWRDSSQADSTGTSAQPNSPASNRPSMLAHATHMGSGFAASEQQSLHRMSGGAPGPYMTQHQQMVSKQSAMDEAFAHQLRLQVWPNGAAPSSLDRRKSAQTLPVLGAPLSPARQAPLAGLGYSMPAAATTLLNGSSRFRPSGVLALARSGPPTPTQQLPTNSNSRHMMLSQQQQQQLLEQQQEVVSGGADLGILDHLTVQLGRQLSESSSAETVTEVQQGLFPSAVNSSTVLTAFAASGAQPPAAAHEALSAVGGGRRMTEEQGARADATGGGVCPEVCTGGRGGRRLAAVGVHASGRVDQSEGARQPSLHWLESGLEMSPTGRGPCPGSPVQKVAKGDAAAGGGPGSPKRGHAEQPAGGNGHESSNKKGRTAAVAAAAVGGAGSTQPSRMRPVTAAVDGGWDME